MKTKMQKAGLLAGLFCVMLLVCFGFGRIAYAKTKPCDAPVRQIYKVLKTKNVTAKQFAQAIDRATPAAVLKAQGTSRPKDYRYMAKGVAFLKQHYKHQKVAILSRRNCSKKELRRIQKRYTKHHQSIVRIRKAKKIRIGAKGGSITVTVMKTGGKWYIDRADALKQVRKANKVLRSFNFEKTL